MVYLLLDSGKYRKLSYPCEIKIGRGSDNDIQPDSQSVSKNHAILTLSKSPKSSIIGNLII